jgi:hypothetical protein
MSGAAVISSIQDTSRGFNTLMWTFSFWVTHNPLAHFSVGWYSFATFHI